MEARRRVQDPVYGCAGIVGRLQGEIGAAQCELARTQAQIAVHAAAARAPHPASAVDALAAAQHAPAAPLQQQDDDDEFSAGSARALLAAGLHKLGRGLAYPPTTACFPALLRRGN